MGLGDHADLGRQGTDLVGTAAVEPHAVLDDPAAHRLLHDGAERLDGAGPVLVLLPDVEGGQGRFERLGFGGPALHLVGDRDDVADVRGRGFLDPGQQLIAIGLDGDPRDGLRRRQAFLQLELEVDELGDVLLGLLQAAGHGGLVAGGRALGDEAQRVLGGAGLDHDEVDAAVLVAASDHHQIEHGIAEMLVRGHGDPLAVDEPHADSAERPLEGDRADGQRRRGAVEREDVVGVLLVDRQDRGDDVRLGLEVLAERRAQRPVDQAGGEDGLLGGSPFPPEERAGDAPHRVHALFDVDGEREEVDAFPQAAAGGGGGEHLGAPCRDDDGAVGQLRQLAGPQDDLRLADPAAYRDF